MQEFNRCVQKKQHSITIYKKEVKNFDLILSYTSVNKRDAIKNEKDLRKGGEKIICKLLYEQEMRFQVTTTFLISKYQIDSNFFENTESVKIRLLKNIKIQNFLRM